MKRKHLTLFSLLLFLIFSAYGQMRIAPSSAMTVDGGQEQGVFWKIDKEGMEQPAYLFGTYHLLNEGFLNEWPGVHRAFEASDEVVVEMVIDSSALGQAMMMGMMTDQTLEALLDSSEFHMLDDETQQSLGMSLSQLNQMKPIVVSLLLTLSYNQAQFPELASIPGLPMDAYFGFEGEKAGKEVRGLETLLEQSELLYNYGTPEEQADDLVEMVREKEEAIQLTKDILVAYRDNDFQVLQELGEDSADWGGMEELLDKRNERWLKLLPGILEEGKVFIAVGALHLTGSKGLVHELREMGYTVEPAELK
ncbi:MAG: TraB/GumN family protein [Flavobacteriales bacterium]|nr:TraB/GumN family protein [Flavobacteriales bacterium]